MRGLMRPEFDVSQGWQRHKDHDTSPHSPVSTYKTSICTSAISNI
jgi:hypothetical protein